MMGPTFEETMRMMLLAKRFERLEVKMKSKSKSEKQDSSKRSPPPPGGKK